MMGSTSTVCDVRDARGENRSARRWRPEAASTPSQGAVLVGVETVADRLGLVRRVECLGQSEARRSPFLRATDARRQIGRASCRERV